MPNSSHTHTHAAGTGAEGAIAAAPPSKPIKSASNTTSSTAATTTNSFLQNTSASSLSMRGQRNLKPPVPYLEKLFGAMMNQYDPLKNPNGAILLCVAENKLNYPMLLEKLNECRPQLTDEGAANLGGYNDWNGFAPFREAIVKFLNYRLLQPVDVYNSPISTKSPPSSSFKLEAKNILVSNGVGPMLSNLSYLLGEPCDAMLIPAPYYPAFDNDLSNFAQLLPIPVHTEPTNYRITKEILQDAYDRFDKLENDRISRQVVDIEVDHFPEGSHSHSSSHFHPPATTDPVIHEDVQLFESLHKTFRAGLEKPRKVCAILITNPNNPLGICYSEEEILTIIKFAQDRQIHVVFDEIYANSVFNPLVSADSPPPASISETLVSTPFVSALSVVSRLSFTELPYPHLVHFIYGLSKDWCLSGYRVGICATFNESIIAAWGSMGYFCGIPTDLQYSFSKIFNDEEWVNRFLNVNCEKLRENYDIVASFCEASHESIVSDELDDPSMTIPIVPASAGMFVWIDLRGFLKSKNDEDSGNPASIQSRWDPEDELWNTIERDCCVIFTPGRSCHANEPGFFRLCFGWIPQDTLCEAMRRVRRRLKLWRNE